MMAVWSEGMDVFPSAVRHVAEMLIPDPDRGWVDKDGSVIKCFLLLQFQWNKQCKTEKEYGKALCVGTNGRGS